MSATKYDRILPLLEELRDLQNQEIGYDPCGDQERHQKKEMDRLKWN